MNLSAWIFRCIYNISREASRHELDEGHDDVQACMHVSGDMFRSTTPDPCPPSFWI